MIDKIFGKDKDDFQYRFGHKFKFKSLKVYCSPEWMYGATKKYRRVFDRAELDYVRAEFSFYNKLFDEMEWETEVSLKAFALKGTKREELCDQPEKMVVKPDKNVVTYHKGWGAETLGTFWKKGKYLWEAYIDGIMVGSQEFFVEEVGLVTPKSNPYFELTSIKVFNGPFDGWNIKDRKYLRKFNRDTTQFVWAEVAFQNKTPSDWQCELFINFFDDAGQLKGQATAFRKIAKGKKGAEFIFEEGWGSKDGGSWKDDRYTAQVVFMDTLVGVVAFEMGSHEEEGVAPLRTTVEEALFDQPKPTDQSLTLEQVMAELDALTGLASVKQSIRQHIQYLDFIKLRKEKGFNDSEKISLHSQFTGNPGTGKTTVVKLLGKIYKHMGLLSSGHVHEVDRADLIGEFIGQTAPKVKKAIDEARGGILFIDEAYSLTRKNEDSKDYGNEVIEVLVKEMSDGQGDLAIMVAGYPKEMDYFMKSNPGLKSRFNHLFHFDDYLPDELLQIALAAARQRTVTFDADAQAALAKILTEAFRARDKSFGNARYAISLVDEAKMNLGLRLMAHPDVSRLGNTELSTILPEDVERIAQRQTKMQLRLSIDEALLKEALGELNALVGLHNIKNDVNELVKLVRYYRETGKDVLNRFSLHTVFKGNPGTGKTTVARILGKVFKSLGMLERGHVTEVGREDLVAGYTGQTALKTREKMDVSLGGVLFIDEAYSLADQGQGGFGKEAIEVILKHMEDNRGKIAVIVAGYPDNMEFFLKANPGLRSRFDRTFVFKDYTVEELLQIAQNMLAQEKLYPDAEALRHVSTYLAKIHAARSKFFGNAREVRKMVESTVKNQHLRMASTPAETRTKEMMETVALADVRDFAPEGGTSSVGFNF